MADLFQIGKSALLGFRTSLAVTGQNIANVDTPLYTRQRTDLSAVAGQAVGRQAVGNGLQVDGVRRLADQFLDAQLIFTRANFNRESVAADLSSRLDQLLGSENTGLDTAISSFFDSSQVMATDPTAIAARQVMLSDARLMTDRFNALGTELRRQRDGANQQISQAVDEINSIAQGIANLNNRIAENSRTLARNNELLDQRNRLLNDLSKIVDIGTLEADDGTLTVFIGQGQALVLGDKATPLLAQALGQDKTAIDVNISTPSGPIPITRQINGGKLAGIIDFRDNILTEAQNGLGRVGIVLARNFNLQHQQGLDLNGQPGQLFFGEPAVTIVQNQGNSLFGADPIAFSIVDTNQLTTADYRFERIANAGGAGLPLLAADFQLTNLQTGQVAPLTLNTAGDGLLGDGLQIMPAPAAAVGDVYELRPTREAALGISLLLTDPATVAAAASHVTQAATGNTGSGVISPVTVDFTPPSLGSADPNFFRDLTVNFFRNPPSVADQFEIRDAQSGALISGPTAFVPGTPVNIGIQGLQFTISGTPADGDSFTVVSNAGAVGDNSNGLSLAQLQQAFIVNGSTATLQETNQALVGQVGTNTRQASIAADAQQSLLNNAIGQRDQISGVNLDEEAANLQREQQFFIAASQVIAAADTVFNALLDAVRR